MFSRYFTTISCIITLLSCVVFSSEIEVDVAWNFNTVGDTQGWGNATSSQNDLTISATTNGLVCAILGSSPVLDSPSLFLDITTQQYAVINMSYLGLATTFDLLLRTGVTPSPAQQLAFNTQYWTARQSMTVVSDSGSLFSNESSSKAIDGLTSTFFMASTSTNAYIILDLGDYRQITQLRLMPFGDSTNPRHCFLQQSATSGVGPFSTVISFTG